MTTVEGYKQKVRRLRQKGYSLDKIERIIKEGIRTGGFTWGEVQEFLPEVIEVEPQEEYKDTKYDFLTWVEYLEEAEEVVKEESEEELGLSEKARELERNLPGYAEVTEEDDVITITAKRGVDTTKLPKSVLEVVGDFQEEHDYGLEALRSVSQGMNKYTSQQIILKPE